MANPRYLVESNGDSRDAEGRAGLSTRPTIPATQDIPPQRRCVYTDTWCRCTVPDSPTMHACARHVLGEVA